MTCGQPHPMRQHADLTCDREAGHPGAHRALLFPGTLDTLEWSRRPEDACAPEGGPGSIGAVAREVKAT